MIKADLHEGSDTDVACDSLSDDNQGDASIGLTQELSGLCSGRATSTARQQKLQRTYVMAL